MDYFQNKTVNNIRIYIAILPPSLQKVPQISVNKPGIGLVVLEVAYFVEYFKI